MLSRWRYDLPGSRDMRIDYLRGLAMTCVIVDHSKLSSVLAWFSYERFWVVTAAEVFILLSGITIGMTYKRKLDRAGWPDVLRGLARRTALLYGAFALVTLSVIVLSLLGVDVRAITTTANGARSACFADPPLLDSSILGNVVLMRCAPWPFQIVGLYVWLVAATVPCLLALRAGRWRGLLAVSWALYLVYRVAPGPLTSGSFEQTFPILPWQLLFVHGLAIGYHRARLGEIFARHPRRFGVPAAAAAVVFLAFALSNPWNEGPSWLHWHFVSPDRFAYLYFHYFSLSALGIGRIANVAVALPVGYLALTRVWTLARPLGAVFVTLGQHSLGAFVLHVYGIALVSYLPLGNDALGAGIVQVVLIVLIVGLLKLPEQITPPPLISLRLQPSAA